MIAALKALEAWFVCRDSNGEVQGLLEEGLSSGPCAEHAVRVCRHVFRSFDVLVSNTGAADVACWTAVVESATLPLHILVDHAEFKAGGSSSCGIAIGAGAGVPHSSYSLSTSKGGTGWRKKR